MSAAIQLPLEQALKAFIVAQSISGYGASAIFCAHEKSKVAPDTTGTYLGIIADPPDWLDMVHNAVVPVRFECVTAGIQDHTLAAALTSAHADRVAKIVELFSDQTHATTLAALNALTGTAPGFTGYEAQPPDPDGTSPDDTQLITRLPYIFEVFLKT